MNQKWHYRSCIVDKPPHHGQAPSTDDLDPVLQAWAAEGWELVSTNAPGDKDGWVDRIYLFWRQPVTS